MILSSNHHIDIVVAEWNRSYTQQLQHNAIHQLQSMGVVSAQIKVHTVPGCVEIPFASQQVAQKKTCAGVIALGCVLRGETPHFDLVCDMFGPGIMRVMLDVKKPIICGVMTVNSHAQARERCLFGGIKDIGKSSAQSLIAMLPFA